MEKRISIIVPVYNAEKYIERCLNTLIKQSYKPFEIIIIDDGSNDNSFVKCNDFKNNNKDFNIKLISQKNSGPSKARNRGIEESTGEHIMFVDADDYLELNALENIIKNVEENVLVKINYKTFKESKINNLMELNNEFEVNEFIEKIFNDGYPGSVWGCLFERKIINNIRFLNEIYFLEDTLFLIEYLKKIKKVKFVKGNYYYCLSNENSITVSKTKVLSNIKSFCYALDKIKKILEKHYYKRIDNKKLILIEKEIAKLNHYSDLKNVIICNDFYKIITEINKENIDNKFYRLLLALYKKKNIYLLFIYVTIRKAIKNIKNIGGN